MKYLSLPAVAIQLTIAPCFANSQSDLFRVAFFCPDRGPSAVCVFGTIPKATKVTLLATNWKSSGTPKEKFPNTEFNNNFKTITRIAVAAPPPKRAFLIAILAAAETVNVLPLKEIRDEALVERIVAHIKSAKQLDLQPDTQILKTRLLRLSPTILLSETCLAAPPYDAVALEKDPTGSKFCDDVPMLVGKTLTDLFLGVESACGGIRLAFALSGRPYLVSYAATCEGDSFAVTLVHDLSGKKPKLVFSPVGGG
jgi:hypothetical protein